MRLADRIIEALYDRQGQSIWLDEVLRDAKAKNRALAEALEELARRGHRIEQTPSGAHLVWPPVLDAHLIERMLPVRRVGKHVICFEQVDSTNDTAFAAIAKASPGEAVVVTAESQKAGRGRLGRKWVSDRGSGILCSVALAGEEASPLAHEPLTIGAGLAVAMGVEDATGVPTELEWPNDVTSGGAKLAGVLVEMRRSAGGPGRADATKRVRGPLAVVIGFGVNVLSAPPSEQAGRRTASVADSGGGTLDRIAVLRAILVQMDYWIDQIGSGDFDSLHRQWLSRCGMIHQRITVEQAGRRITGRVADVSPLEGLLLVDDLGKNHVLPAASSSIVR